MPYTRPGQLVRLGRRGCEHILAGCPRRTQSELQPSSPRQVIRDCSHVYLASGKSPITGMCLTWTDSPIVKHWMHCMRHRPIYHIGIRQRAGCRLLVSSQDESRAITFVVIHCTTRDTLQRERERARQSVAPAFLQSL